MLRGQAGAQAKTIHMAQSAGGKFGVRVNTDNIILQPDKDILYRREQTVWISACLCKREDKGLELI